MLKQLSDDRKHVYEFYFYFKALPMVNSDSIPFVELGTILKHKKPKIFNEIKLFSKRNQVIEIITSVEMDLQEAIQNIHAIVDI